MEDLKLTRNRDKELIERATLVVEEYISQQRLIIYGGTAIDFALRTRGKNIYNDVALKYADYDFFSSNVTRDSYDLACALRTKMATDDINIINGIHMRTLKVSIEGHFIADITYCPESVVARIPTMEYTTIAGNKVAIVAPHYQAIDMHSALSQPFDNPPMEVYNHRINKDITRYNIVYDEFFGALREAANGTISAAGATAPAVTQKLSIAFADIGESPCMFISLASLFMLLNVAEQKGYKPRTTGTVVIDSERITLTFEAPPAEYFIEAYLMGSKHALTHHRLLDILPESTMTKTAILYNADPLLYPSYTITVENTSVAFICAQGVLKQMMAKYVFTGNVFYLRCYFDLIDALAHVETNAGDTDAMKPFLCGTGVWPGAASPNIAMSTLYTLYLHDANLEDRREGEGVATRRNIALAARPPQLRLGDRNIEQRAADFLAWTSQKRYFLVDGGRITAPNA